MRKTLTVIALIIAIFAIIGFRSDAGALTTGILEINPVVGAQLSPSARMNFSRLSYGNHDGNNSDLSPVHRKIYSRIAQAKMSYQLSNDASALLTEICDLQLMAQDSGLTLNSQQWSTFAAVVLRTQAIRQTYEAQIATSKAIAPGQYRVEIPVYASVGDALRQEFNDELRQELGAPMAANVLAKLGERLEARFAGFGVSAQTLDIAAAPGAQPSDIQITRTVTYWNSVEGSDHATTRREIHFPADEDPTGDSWSALLAMVKA
jgi:hypothetical protein